MPTAPQLVTPDVSGRVATADRDEAAIRIRPIKPTDVEGVARIAFDAFAGIADRHGFPRDFPTYDAALEFIAGVTDHPSIWGVVAECAGHVVGSNFLDERAVVVGVGPITVDPAAQTAGVGRRLMEAVLDRARPAESVRLFQDSFNVGSLALYASLGFRVVEPVVLVGGVPGVGPSAGVAVRPLVEDDLDSCLRLCRSVLGYDRTAELCDALDAPSLTPMVAHRGRRLVAYATTLADFGAAYAVGETENDLFDLVAGAVTQSGAPASFLLPLSEHSLVRSCLAAGLRFVKPMTSMVAGAHRRPRGAWIPSVLS
jgi:predicted N-acetyltransferase YhbS